MKTSLTLTALLPVAALLLASCAGVTQTAPDGTKTTMVSVASKTYARATTPGGEIEMGTDGTEVPKAAISGWKWMEGMRALRGIAGDGLSAYKARDAGQTDRLRIDRAAEVEKANIDASIERAGIEASAAEAAAAIAPAP